MIFNLQYEKDREDFIKLSGKLFDAQATVELTEKRPKRSLKQNSYLHLALSWFAIEYGCSLDEAKVDFFKRMWNSDLFIRENPQRLGTTYLRSTADLSDKEMQTAIERFRNFSASEAGIYIPSPNEREFLSHIEREISRSTYL